MQFRNQFIRNDWFSNIDVWDFELTEQEMNIIRNKDTGKNILGYDLEHPEQGEWKDFLLNLKVES